MELSTTETMTLIDVVVQETWRAVTTGAAWVEVMVKGAREAPVLVRRIAKFPSFGSQAVRHGCVVCERGRKRENVCE